MRQFNIWQYLNIFGRPASLSLQTFFLKRAWSSYFGRIFSLLVLDSTYILLRLLLLITESRSLKLSDFAQPLPQSRLFPYNLFDGHEWLILKPSIPNDVIHRSLLLSIRFQYLRWMWEFLPFVKGFPYRTIYFRFVLFNIFLVILVLFYVQLQ